MKVKTSYLGIAFGIAAFLLLAACAKTPQNQLQASELDKSTYQKALSAQNLELCAVIEDKDLKTNCETTIKEQKLETEIVASKDASKCSQLTIETLQKTCEIEIKAGIEAEKKSQEIQQEAQNKNDLFNQIVQEGNPSKCSQLKDKNLQNICADSIYFNKATSAKDTNLCTKIEDKERRLSCENMPKD